MTAGAEKINADDKNNKCDILKALILKRCLNKMKLKKTFPVQAEPTPNPSAMKFIVHQKITDKTAEFNTLAEAHLCPLAQTILQFPWAKRVFIGEDFISVSKEDWAEWSLLTTPLKELIQEHLETGKPILTSLPPSSFKKTIPQEFNSKDQETIKKIKHIIKQDIQPFVQMDGGFIEFENYQSGNIYLKMKGACAGCPSALVTLKQGIESKIKESLPEIKEVIAVEE